MALIALSRLPERDLSHLLHGEYAWLAQLPPAVARQCVHEVHAAIHMADPPAAERIAQCLTSWAGAAERFIRR